MSVGSTIDHFPDIHELKRFTRNFITIRTESLKKDVKHCLLKAAAFPAILYCLSTIDLMGALYAGQARQPVDTKTNSMNYMKEFMNYTDEQATLIIKIFRHKLVHLAQPLPVFEHCNKNVRWVYHHADSEKHLIVEDLPPGMSLIIKSDWKIRVDQYFNISIIDLMQDILNSVHGHGGFLDKFETDSVVIQPNVKRALEQVYDPKA